MKKVIFEDPCGNKESVTDIKLLKKLLIDEFNTYWMRGSVEGVFDFYDNDEKTSTLIVAPNTEYGLYLHFIDNISDTDLLSLNDEDTLYEVAETADELYVSVGLFLPVELAWDGIVYFIENGKTSPKIRWITPDDLPDDGGNWY